MLEQFADDVRKGFLSKPKYLLSKYFYDDEGSRIFRKIMEMPEYYLTDCEFDVFRTNADEILKAFSPDGNDFNLLEFGAGDGAKTKVLLRHFLDMGAKFDYLPIDISKDALDGLITDLKNEMPGLNAKGLHNDYFQALKELNHKNGKRSIVLFLGSNIGNFTMHQAWSFLSELHSTLSKGDMLMIGFDLKKDPEIILNAYSDPHGITADFNLNLLRRINRELDADIDVSKFRHFQMYDPVGGETKSFLISLEEHEARIGYLNEKFHFKRSEPIFTELSQKYSNEDIASLARRSGFVLKENFYDSRSYFVDSLWER